MSFEFLDTINPRANYDLMGHDRNIDFILSSYKRKRLHQAYILSGNEGVGKATFAYSFSRILLSGSGSNNFTVDKNLKTCKLIEANTHPDLLILEPLNGQRDRFISIEQARKCSEFFNHTPSISDWRVCIIDSIDFMDISTSNTILKILEEPPSHCIFLIISQKIDSVIETIISRCIEIKFQDLNRGVVLNKVKLLKPELLESEVGNLVNLSEGSLGKMTKLLEDDSIKIYNELDDIIFKKNINESIYNFSDFILKDDSAINKFNIFTECIVFKVGELIKGLTKINSAFSINKALDLRNNILETIQQERVLKLNKKQTILSVVIDLNKITNLQ